MATSTIANIPQVRAIHVKNWTNIKGFTITVNASKVYTFLNGFIISRQGLSAFMMNLNGAGTPSVSITTIMGTDAIAASVSGQTVSFEATTTWNDFTLVCSGTIPETDVAVGTISGT